MANHKQKTIRLTMAQAVVQYLQLQYSERDGQTRRLIPAIFGIFGHGNVAGIGQAIEEYGVELPYYQPHNEQSMVHTASGFAKANRRLATLACTSSIGPGATNMVTGAATATINRLPVLLLPADYYATRHQGPVLQELEHPVSADVSVNDCLRPVSRFFDRISRPEQLLTALPEAMRVLTDPAETGAVTVALPQDVQAHAYDYPVNFFQEKTWPVERRLPDPTRIQQALEMIGAAERPMIIAGGGVIYSGAENELLAVAEKFGIPVGETFAGKGAVDNAASLSMGGFGVTGAGSAGKIVHTADLIIAVGTRLNDFATGSQSAFHHPDVKFICINVNARDAFKQGALPVVADAREALRALLEAAAALKVTSHKDYLNEVAVAKQQWKTLLETEVFVQREGEAMSQLHAIQVINKQARSGDTIIAAAGGPPGDLHQLWDTSNHRRCLLEFGFSCMGFELPAGLGVRLDQPEGEVYVFIGDGTYMMQPTELATAAQEGLKITVVVVNNHGYQIIRRLQMASTGVSFGNEFRERDQKTNRLEGDFVEIDIAKNAESMGAKTWNVHTPDELQQALHEARAESRYCVIVAEVEPHRYGPSSEVWWDVAAAEVSSHAETQQIRATYEAKRAELQKFHY